MSSTNTTTTTTTTTTETTTAICEQCGQIVLTADALTDDGLCAHCADVKRHTCDHCGAYVDDLETMFETIDGDHICADCAEPGGDYVECDDCHKYVRIIDGHIDEHGTALCDNCYDRGAITLATNADALLMMATLYGATITKKYTAMIAQSVICTNVKTAVNIIQQITYSVTTTTTLYAITVLSVTAIVFATVVGEF